MKPRILLAVILFLVIPTATLSIIAGRVLRNREFFLDLLIKSSAVNDVRAVAERVDDALTGDLEYLRLGVKEVLSRGGGTGDVGAEVAQLTTSRHLIEEAYVFMNPWGFVYPRADAAGESDGQTAAGLEALVPALQQAISSAESWDSDVCVTVADSSYCFRRIAETRSLYVGYRVDWAPARSILVNALLSFSGGGVALVASGPGIDPVRAPHSDGGIVVRDSFGGGGDGAVGVPSAGDASTSGHTGVPLAQGRLRPPLDHIQVLAYEARQSDFAAGPGLKPQLMAWGVLLLVGAIIIGIWVVLRETTSEVRQARSRSDFVIGVSHDLRTPVASMKMLSESLFEGRVSGEEKEKQFLGLMVRECERLDQLVERVLFFVRFGQNALVFQPTLADMSALVSSATASFESRFKMSSSGGGGAPRTREHAAVSVEAEDGLPGVCVDEGAMVQVLLNLLDNAWKYSRGEGHSGDADAAPITVSVRAVTARPHRLASARDCVAVSVADRGIGIDPRAVKRIFSRFYRGAAALDSNVSGVGLGLALCRHVVQAHRGWIDVESRPGEGSTFTVYLPAVGTTTESPSHGGDVACGSKGRQMTDEERYEVPDPPLTTHTHTHTPTDLGGTT